MMRLLAVLLYAIAAAALPLAASAAARDVPADPYAAKNAFVVLSYHEARDDVREYPDAYAVDTAALVAQFAWLRGNGYTPVSLDAILDARRGGKSLPPKAVLLTFDDGYLSFYTRVYPLLREFRFPAVLAVVGKWIDKPAGEPSLYGEKSSVPVASFPSWAQVREMAGSGWVEIASHTYDLHRGVLANPQLNLQPAATSRVYDAATSRYEDDTSWRARVSTDLAANSATIERESGRRPRVIVWPYGSYNDELVRMAGEWGMTIGLTLDDGVNTAEVPATALRRTLVEHNPALAEYRIEVRGPRYPRPVRVVHLSLDEIYSADAGEQERNLSALLDRVLVLQPTHVYLQATADSDGDGIADMAYFPNRHLPVRADLFNRVAWQLASRTDVKVFAVMPLDMARLPTAAVTDVYSDLARHANIDGLVFDDGARTGDESASLQRTHELATAVRNFRAPLQTVRMVRLAPSPGVALPAALLGAYDFVALVSTPACNDEAIKPAWPGAASSVERQKTVFLLRSASPSAEQNCAAVANAMRTLQLQGALNFGYAPRDFLHDQPPLAEVAPALSLRVNPLAAIKEK